MNISLLVTTRLLDGIFGEKHFTRLRKQGELAIYDRNNFEDRAHVLEFLKGSFIIVTSWGSPAIDQEMLDLCPTLSAEQIAALGAEKRELNELLAESDVISIHSPDLPATRHMINKDNIGLLKERVVIVNTARGTIFDEPYLIERLKECKGMFACIDITEVEPPAADNELRFLDNVNLTSHLAGTASNGRRRIALHICEEVERFVAGERMKAEINREALSRMA